MDWGFERLTAALALLWLALFALPVQAATPFEAGSYCHAGAEHFETYEQVAADPARWTCDAANWQASPEKTFIRFDLRGTSAAAPTRFITRLTRFAELGIRVTGSDGMTVTRTVRPGDMTIATGDWLMSTALPPTSAPARDVVIEVHRPRFIGMLSDARLGNAVEAQGNGLRFELLIAALCGMLCMPLLFNLAFYGVLRERFLLWHAVAVGFMLVQTLVTSGLVNRLHAFSIYDLSVLSAATFGGGIAGALMFLADLMEDGTVDAVHRRLLRIAALAWIPASTAFYLFSSDTFRALAASVYYLSWLPVVALMVWVMVTARLRGSRAVNWQIAAWMPFMLSGLVRVITALGVTEAPLEMQGAQHVSLAIEVLVTALGVADRFLTIKRQRDSALAEARMLEDRIERDPLTGLLNRHAIENRFAALHAQGFRTVAVLDLDRFKEINDTYGHGVGDMVLRAVGKALMPDDRTIAIRLGGEEFMLVLSGTDAAEQAERRRQAIAVRIAADVPGLDRLVTASMGLVEYGAGTRVEPDFAASYLHCDRLLYDAKRAGRNRTMKEKVRSFSLPALPLRVRERA
jgi:diguanylate cyclase (GGDEF)-like protein